MRVSDCLNRDGFDYELHQEMDTYYPDHAQPYRQEHTYGPDPHDAAIQHFCCELKKMLSGGTFYYSLTFDLTNRLQDRYVKSTISTMGKPYSLLDGRNNQHLISII